MNYLKQILVTSLLFCITITSVAATDKNAELDALSNQIKSITYKLDRGNFDQEDLAKWTKVAIKLSGEASVCIADNEARIKKAQESLDGLGEKVKDEAAEVTKQRNKLQKEKEELDKALAQCNLFKQTSDKASEHISLAEKSYFREKYLIRGPHIYTLAVEYLKNPFELIADSGTFFLKHAGIQELNATEALVIFAIVILTALIGLWLRRVLLKLEHKIEWHDDYSEHFAQAALTTFAQYLPWLVWHLNRCAYFIYSNKEYFANAIYNNAGNKPVHLSCIHYSGSLYFFTGKTGANIYRLHARYCHKALAAFAHTCYSDIRGLHGFLYGLFRKHSRIQSSTAQRCIFITVRT